jgi:hypothetical protein
VLVLLAAQCELSACTRHASSRIFLHGDTVNEREEIVPYAVVRIAGRESISDENGHYRFLFVEPCLRAFAGTHGIETLDLEGFSPNYERFNVGVHFDTMEMVGLASCPADTDRYIRVTFVKKSDSTPNQSHLNRFKSRKD